MMQQIRISGRTHEVKSWPEYFEAVVDGRKTFDVRKDDRGYAVGDVIVFKEFDREKQDYTGREEASMIVYVYRGGDGESPVRLVDGDTPVVVLGITEYIEVGVP